MAYNLKDESEVKQYLENLGIEYRFGCYSENKPEVCHLLGDYLESIKKDFEKAAKVYKSNCDDYGFAKSCFKYGNYSFVGKGKTASQGDPKQAYHYYEKGCNLNDPDSCFHSGLLLVSRTMPKQIERNVPKAVEFLTKSCDMNNGAACFYLSGMYISGVQKQAEASPPSSTTKINDADYVIHKDMKKAFEFAYKACELKSIHGCRNLSIMYDRGDGTEKNPEKAEKYKRLTVEMEEQLKQQPTLTFQQGLSQ